MYGTDIQANIRRLFHVEHMKVHAISAHLGVSRDVVRRALDIQHFSSNAIRARPSILNPYLLLIEEILSKHPRIRAPRLFTLIKERGYKGSVSLLRLALRNGLRPRPKRAYQILTTFPGEQGQVDWGSFGKIKIGNAERALSCFIMVLSWSRAIYARFMLDQTLSSFMAAHQTAFRYLGGVPRQNRYDNLKSVVISRDGRAIQFNDNFLEFAGNYGFLPSACNPYSGHEKGKVERTVRYIRDSFFVHRRYRDVDDLNRQLSAWISDTAMARAWPDDHSKTITEQWEVEKRALLALPVHDHPCERREEVRIGKTPYARFDLNDYSVPWRLTQTTLTILASETQVKIFNDKEMVSDHVRSYARQQRITDDSHLSGIYDYNPGAEHLQSRDRLLRILPESHAYLELVYAEQGRMSRVVEYTEKLIAQFGKDAVLEAMKKSVDLGRHDSWFLKTATRSTYLKMGAPPALPLYLPEREDVRNVCVEPRDLTRYDQLSAEHIEE